MIKGKHGRAMFQMNFTTKKSKRKEEKVSIHNVMMIQKGNDKMFGEWSNKLQNEDKRFVVNVVCL
jgi:hypothetical protein